MKEYRIIECSKDRTCLGIYNSVTRENLECSQLNAIFPKRRFRVVEVAIKNGLL